MGKKSKLIKRSKSRPKDFTYDDVKTLLGYFSYEERNKGKTSGSHVIFSCKGRNSIMFHKPHSRKTLLDYEIKKIIICLEREGLI